MYRRVWNKKLLSILAEHDLPYLQQDSPLILSAVHVK